MSERAELIDLVERIVAGEGTEQQIEAWLDEFQSRVPHPAATDLVYHHDTELTADEIVDLALAYRAFRSRPVSSEAASWFAARCGFEAPPTTEAPKAPPPASR